MSRAIYDCRHPRTVDLPETSFDNCGGTSRNPARETCVKQLMTYVLGSGVINATLAGHRARRGVLISEPDIVAATLAQGAELATNAAQATVLHALHAIRAISTTAATDPNERSAQ